MPHSVSAARSMRNSARRNLFNKSVKSICATQVKKVNSAIASGSRAEAEKALVIATQKMQKATKRNIIHKNTVSRKISRLARKVAAMQTNAAAEK